MQPKCVRMEHPVGRENKRHSPGPRRHFRDDGIPNAMQVYQVRRGAFECTIDSLRSPGPADRSNLNALDAETSPRLVLDRRLGERSRATCTNHGHAVAPGGLSGHEG
jgi:hypothetical protein